MEEALLWLRWVESNRCENCLGSCIGHAVETDLLEVGLERAAANEHYRYALCHCAAAQWLAQDGLGIAAVVYQGLTRGPLKSNRGCFFGTV